MLLPLTPKSRERARPKGLPPAPKVDLERLRGPLPTSVRIVPVITLSGTPPAHATPRESGLLESAGSPVAANAGSPKPGDAEPDGAERASHPAAAEDDSESWDSLLARSRREAPEPEEYGWEALRERAEVRDAGEWFARLAHAKVSRRRVEHRFGRPARAVMLWP